MALFLEITDGDMKGTRTAVRDGVVIGRKEGSLTIRDSKLSSKHVKIEERFDGSLWMVDLGSSNGIKTTAGKVRELQLSPNIEFVLGRTSFRVVTSDEAAQSDDVPTSALAATVTRTFWDSVRELAERGAKQAKDLNRPIQAIEPVVRLKFIRGLMTGTEWTIGYGPREVGSASLDLAINDPDLPETCFKLMPNDEGVLFKNEALGRVKVNGQAVDAVILKDGDVIEVSSSRIQVSIQ